MKFALAFFALIFVVAVHAICDPDSDGEPVCDSSNEGAILRNFWDPTRYWQCKDGIAMTVRCPSQTGFLNATAGCVSWGIWKWTPPCPQ